MTKWPHDDSKSLTSFYGKPGTNLVQLTPPWPMVTAWTEGGEFKPIPHFAVNKKCLDAFDAALNAIWDHVGQSQDAIHHYHLHLFGGCFNNRPVRGSSKISVHAFGAAIDLNPDGAPMGVKQRPTQEQLPDFVVEAFKGVGAVWGFEFKGRKDPMHFQFANEG